MAFEMDAYTYVKAFTSAYQSRKDSSPALREAACLAVMADGLFLPPEEGDLFCGRLRTAELGFSPEPLLGRSVAYYHDSARLDLLRKSLPPEQQEELDGIKAFWAGEETRRRIRESYPCDMREALPEDIYWEHSQIAFPLYRVVDAYLDYHSLLCLGLPGLRQKIEGRRALFAGGTQEAALYEGMLWALDSLTRLCLRYAKLSEERGLQSMAQVMRALANRAPKTFPEAAQLLYLYALISGALNYGRMDDDLGDFLATDIDSGRLTEDEALAYIQSLWRLIAARGSVFHGRVIIGGRGRRNETNADRFARLAIEASRTVALTEPQLSLRFYKGQNPALMDAAMDCIAEGRTYPVLYCDEVNIPAVRDAFCVTEDEAEHYMMFGCGEYVLNHRSFGSPNGVLNLLKLLETTISGGRDLWEDKALGLSSGGLVSHKSFEDFYKEYLRHARFYIEILARQEQLEYGICAQNAEFLYFSMLFDDCLERGRGLFGGGARYLGGTLETYGNTNTANSLFAIKKLVFEEKTISAQELGAALERDFEGFEALREKLLAAPKFGNDDKEVDGFAGRLHNDICAIIREQKNNTSLHSYLAVVINNEANTILGRFTAASADGRKRGAPMANGNMPAPGTEKRGLSAMLRSMASLNTHIHAGSVQNIMLSREMMTKHRSKIRAALDTYFALGGQQAMISVCGREELHDAIAHPDRYPSLMVRVGGFSALFVSLAPDVQREIAGRMVF